MWAKLHLAVWTGLISVNLLRSASRSRDSTTSFTKEGMSRQTYFMEGLYSRRLASLDLVLFKDLAVDNSEDPDGTLDPAAG